MAQKLGNMDSDSESSSVLSDVDDEYLNEPESILPDFDPVRRRVPDTKSPKKTGVNARDKLYGRSKLHRACARGNMDKIVELIEVQGASIDVIDNNGVTPLHDACTNGHYLAVQYLLKKGSAKLVNAQDRHGDCPLLDATEFNSIEICQLLLDLGADPNLTNKEGSSALSEAGEGPLKELLRQYSEKAISRPQTASRQASIGPSDKQPTISHHSSDHDRLTEQADLQSGRRSARKRKINYEEQDYSMEDDLSPGDLVARPERETRHGGKRSKNNFEDSERSTPRSARSQASHNSNQSHVKIAPVHEPSNLSAIRSTLQPISSQTPHVSLSPEPTAQRQNILSPEPPQSLPNRDHGTMPIPALLTEFQSVGIPSQIDSSVRGSPLPLPITSLKNTHEQDQLARRIAGPAQSIPSHGKNLSQHDSLRRLAVSGCRPQGSLEAGSQVIGSSGDSVSVEGPAWKQDIVLALATVSRDVVTVTQDMATVLRDMVAAIEKQNATMLNLTAAINSLANTPHQ